MSAITDIGMVAPSGALGRVTCDTTNTTVTVKWDLDPSADGGTARIVVRLQETGNKRILRPKEVDASRATSTTFHYLREYLETAACLHSLF